MVGSSWDTNMGQYVRYEIGLGWGLALWVRRNMDGDRQAHTQEEEEMKTERNGRMTNKKRKSK